MSETKESEQAKQYRRRFMKAHAEYLAYRRLWEEQIVKDNSK